MGAISEITSLRSGASRFGWLLWIAVSVAIGATAVAMWILYRAALAAEIDRLGEAAYAEARLVEAVAAFDDIESQDAHPEGALMATMQQVAEGHRRWLEQQPQLELAVLARRPGGYVTLALQGRLLPPNERSRSLHFAPSAIAKALAGGSGAVRGEDTDKRAVITGYAWIPEHQIAMLTQVPVARVQQPFGRALMISGFAALVIIGVGGLAFFKTGLPLLDDLERELRERRKSEARLAEHQALLEQTVQARTDELRRTQTELVKAERLATLGKLTATVSHELRNPLGTLRNSLYSLAERTRGKELGVERMLERAQRSTDRCDAIIDELLVFTRNKQPTPERLELGAWARALLAEYEVPGGVRIECNFAPAAWAFADPEDLRRCLVNLLSNAAHAVLEAQHSPLTGKLRIATTVVEHTVALVVEDNGVGMSADVLAHLFEPLFSTKGFGVGLGLCIVADLMRKNGGTIAFASPAERGTRATLTLPNAGTAPSAGSARDDRTLERTHELA